MKISMKRWAVAVVILMLMNTGAVAKQTNPIGEDSLLLLRENYPAVYQQLVTQFNTIEAVHYTVEGKVLRITLTSNGQKILTVYSPDGKIRYAVANLGLVLPALITEQLKNEYPGFSVYYGKDIRVNNKTIYQVIIENKKEYRVIHFTDTEMEEVKRLKK
jgi:hypothetical protein